MASSPYIQYVTQAGDRWDTIAWAYYGIDFMAGINAIVAANPSVPIVGAFDAGISLQVPILQKASDVSSSDLPPWESL
ncbi:MAG TPA: tail protein X [Candidatus Binataceae bacterium]|jgi:phage tail protein X|nr:tail protein X [Candidatus Binataceae bacterium]